MTLDVLRSDHHLELHSLSSRFFFNDTATAVVYTLSLHDALPVTPSTAARGNQAEQFVAEHHDQAGCAHPLDLKDWGKMYGSNSPMLKAYDAGGKLMMLGVDYETDRKSTRLNSSYWCISYAVSCLKKKKNNNRLTSNSYHIQDNM